MKSYIPLALFPLLVSLNTGCEPSAEGSEMAKGEHAYDNYCAQCHMPDGSGNPANEAPAIAGLPAWYVERQLGSFRHGIRGTHYDDVAGMRMRPMALALTSEAQIPAVSQYVETLKVEDGSKVAATLDGNADTGKSYYGTCAACHGTDAAGNETMNAPPLNNANDWYLLTQLKNFKGGVRGAKADDTYGAQMAPMANTLPDEQAMKDVIAYIQTL